MGGVGLGGALGTAILGWSTRYLWIRWGSRAWRRHPWLVLGGGNALVGALLQRQCIPERACMLGYGGMALSVLDYAMFRGAVSEVLIWYPLNSIYDFLEEVDKESEALRREDEHRAEVEEAVEDLFTRLLDPGYEDEKDFTDQNFYDMMIGREPRRRRQ